LAFISSCPKLSSSKRGARGTNTILVGKGALWPDPDPRTVDHAWRPVVDRRRWKHFWIKPTRFANTKYNDGYGKRGELNAWVDKLVWMYFETVPQNPRSTSQMKPDNYLWKNVDYSPCSKSYAKYYSRSIELIKKVRCEINFMWRNNQK
jgi:hypothetical protein